MMKPRLLLVDDEEGIRRVLSVLLADFGYEVATAAGGEDALAALHASAPADLPDIILSDIKMPGLDGLGLLEAVKERWPDIEMLMLTGHGDMELAISSLQLGAGDFLNKPVSEVALEVSLKRAEERRAMRAALRQHTEQLEALVAKRTGELIESERFAAVGETAASLAHAIKNVAGGLEGTMFVLEKALSQNRREYLEEGWEMIKDDVARLKSLALGLLDLGRAHKLEFVPCAPAEILRDVAELFKARADKAGIILEIESSAGSEPSVLAVEAVHQCLCNLTLNALEALEGASEQGKVRLSVFRKIAGQKSFLCYSVSDNGPGMPAETSNAETPRFLSSKESGSGIGLFATRKLVHEMGASLVFNSGPGGTNATLEIMEA